MKEVEAARQQHEGGVVFYTICVEEHKTGKSERAKLVLDKDMYDLLKVWMKVRDALLPPSCPYIQACGNIFVISPYNFLQLCSQPSLSPPATDLVADHKPCKPVNHS